MHSYLPRFSLLSLLLLVTLAAVAISHWLTSRSLREANRHSEQLQWKVRTLNDELGHLTVDDPQKVHVIALIDPIKLPAGYGAPFAKQDNLGWRVFFPAGTRWRMCAAYAGIPEKQLPASATALDLPAGSGDTCDIYASCDYSSTLGWVAELAAEDRTAKCFITHEHAQWLENDEHCEGECAGEISARAAHRYCTESYKADEPVILLRIRKRLPPSRPGLWGDPDPNPCPGLVIWLEPVPDSAAR